MRTFIFSSLKTTALTDCGFTDLPRDYQSKAYRIVHTHLCVYSKCIFTYPQTGCLLPLDSCQISLFLIQECVSIQYVQQYT